MNKLSLPLLALCALSAPAAEITSRSPPLLEIASVGLQPATKGAPDNFAGNVKVEARFQQANPARAGGATVTFEPGARTAWHTHPLGQTLIVTAGTGWVQREGSPKQTIRAGDVVLIPANVKHWHGANDETSMTHVAVAESLNGNVVTWMEHVSDEQYHVAAAVPTKESKR